MFQIFHQGSPLNAVHSFFCHIEVFNNMVLLSKIPFVFLKFLFVSVYFNLSFYKLLILNIVAVHELKAKQKKKKKVGLFIGTIHKNFFALFPGAI